MRWTLVGRRIRLGCEAAPHVRFWSSRSLRDLARGHRMREQVLGAAAFVVSLLADRHLQGEAAGREGCNVPKRWPYGHLICTCVDVLIHWPRL